MQHYQKVKKHVLDPIREFYGGPAITDAVADAFVEDLGKYPEAVLAEAWKAVRRECRTRPSLAHLVKACEEARPKPAQGAIPPRQRDAYVCLRSEKLADEVMRSPAGQLALRLGVGWSVWMVAWRDGKRPTERDVHEHRRHFQEAVDRLARFEDKSSLLYRGLEGLYNGFMAREKELAAKYGPMQPSEAGGHP